MWDTIEQIQEDIITAKEADPNLSELTSTSKVADWRLWTRVTATFMFVLKGLFEAFKAVVLAILAAQKPHTLKWYSDKAKRFQNGDALPVDSDVYAVIDETKQIVKNAAAVEIVGRVRIKVAKLSGSVLAPLAGGELTALTEYMARVKDAGVRLQITSGPPDDLRVGYVIYYDPLILAADGSRLDGTSTTPVQDAVNSYINNLPFNGLFIPVRMTDAIQAVEGVVIPRLTGVSARYGSIPYSSIVTEYNPDAGYLLLDSAFFVDNVTYIPHGAV